MKELKYKKRKENYMMESELFELFRKYARYNFGEYQIHFNGKILSGDTPAKLYSELKKAIKDVQRSK
jgi:hypothetical protein